jgi:hypothetical protein
VPAVGGGVGIAAAKKIPAIRVMARGIHLGHKESQAPNNVHGQVKKP